MPVSLHPGLLPLIEKKAGEFIDFWKEIVQIESNTANKAGVDRVGEATVAFAKKLGFSSFRRVPFQRSGDGFVVEYGDFSKAKPVMFCAHADTVFSFARFGEKTMWVDEEGMIHGPGAADDKAGIVCGMGVLYALKEAGYSARPLKLVISPEEEDSTALEGEAGVAYLESEAASSFCAYNLEGASPSTCNFERFGILTRRIEITGISAHAGHKLLDGRSAVKEAAYKLIAIEKETDPDRLTFNCGLIEGGTAPNAVPASCSITFDVRFKTEEDAAKADAILQRETDRQYIDGTCARLVKVGSRPPLVPSRENRMMLDSYNEVYKALFGTTISPKTVRGGSDVSYFTRAGCPSLDSMGLYGKKSHSAEECASLASFVPRVHTLAQAVLNLPESF